MTPTFRPLGQGDADALLRRSAMPVAIVDGAEPMPAAGPQVAILAVVDVEGTVLEITAEGAASLDWAGHEAVGSPLHAVLHADDVAALELALTRSDADRRAVAAALRVRAPDGTWSPMRGQVSPLSGQATSRFAVALWAIASGEESEPPELLASRLQEHLWRIALEVQAAGIAGVPAESETWWSDPALSQLSPRQLEITGLLVRGDRVPAIARKLFLSQSTVRNHLASVYRTLGVHSQTELLARLKDG